MAEGDFDTRSNAGRTSSFVAQDDLNDLATVRWSGDVLRRLGTSVARGCDYVVGPLAGRRTSVQEMIGSHCMVARHTSSRFGG